MGHLVEVFGNIQEGDLVAKEGSEELVNHSKVKAVVENDDVSTESQTKNNSSTEVEKTTTVKTKSGH